MQRRSAQQVDCNDATAQVHPGAQDLCDGTDNDCDGLVDEDCPQTAGATTFQYDANGNQTRKLAGAGGQDYVFDARDRMVR
jgi:hypothetical protein